MIVVESCPLDWAKKHRIKSKTFKCPLCHELLETSVPYVTKRSFGLMTPKHTCDSRLRGLSYVPKSDEFFESIIKLSQEFPSNNK